MSEPLQLSGYLVLLGAGKMGGAMLKGWLAAGLDPANTVVLDPGPSPEMAELIAGRKIALNPDLNSLDSCAVVVAAVKPQMMAGALGPLARLGQFSPLIVSIAAGKTIASFESVFGASAAVVRAMPNTPAAIGRAITAMAVNENVTAADLSLASTLLSAVGETVLLDSEDQIDAVTGVSGSGPAYVFYLTECLTLAGVRAGLPEALATTLARATVAGAGELMRQSGTDAAILRKNVTSPKGTTHEALQVLMAEPGLADLMSRAVDAATQRARALAEEG